MQPKKPDFSDLDADLDAEQIPTNMATPEFLAAVAEWSETGRMPGISKTPPPEAARKSCPKCGGTGEYILRNGHGCRCYTCDGSGEVDVNYRPRAPLSSDPKRIAARQRRAARKAETKAGNDRDRSNEMFAWIESHKDVFEWVAARTATSSFAARLLSGLTQYGHMTQPQIDAVRRIIAEDAEKDRTVQAPVPQVQTGLDLSGVPDGCYAVPNGDTRLKVKINRPNRESRWYGYIFVRDAAVYGEGRKYGRQAPSRAYEGDIVAELTAIAADPAAAMAAYGKLVGRCGACGRVLEDAASIARGIGPICAEKYGWG